MDDPVVDISQRSGGVFEDPVSEERFLRGVHAARMRQWSFMQSAPGLRPAPPLEVVDDPGPPRPATPLGGAGLDRDRDGYRERRRRRSRVWSVLRRAVPFGRGRVLHPRSSRTPGSPRPSTPSSIEGAPDRGRQSQGLRDPWAR
jgi:hypothetical protein